MDELNGERPELVLERDRPAHPTRSRTAEPAAVGKIVGGGDAPGRASPDRDGYPDRVRRKYYVVGTGTREGDAPARGPTRVYADARGEFLAFKDEGSRLATRLDGADVVRDMVAVAAHRGWGSVRVRGTAAFRREAWVEATARGLVARGYEPDDLDRAVLERRQREVDRTLARGGGNGERPVNAAVSVRGTAPTSTQPRGVEAEQSRVGSSSRDDGDRAAARFRSEERRVALRDPALAAAHSQLALLERALRDVFPADARARRVVLDAARERLAEHLGRGRAIPRAHLRVSEEVGRSGPGDRAPNATRGRQRDQLKTRDR